MAKKGYVVKQPAKAKVAKAKVKAKAKAKARRYRPGERAIREIRLMQRTITPAIPNAPFYRVVSRYLMHRFLILTRGVCVCVHGLMVGVKNRFESYPMSGSQ